MPTSFLGSHTPAFISRDESGSGGCRRLSLLVARDESEKGGCGRLSLLVAKDESKRGGVGGFHCL